MSPRHVLKQRMDRTHLCSTSEQLSTASKRGWRVSISHEKPVKTEELPTIVLPTWVRIKQRKSFRYTNADETARWRYDATLAWSAPTKTEAERAQKEQPPTYEFEIELEYAHPDVSDEYVAESLLAKMGDHPWTQGRLGLCA